MKSLTDLLRWLEAAPDGAMVPARSMIALIRDGSPTPATAEATAIASAGPGWQEHLWTVPADTRMSAVDVGEALRRPKSWVYRHTSPASGLPLLPHRKLDGELVFVAGEVRDWVRTHEDVIVAPAQITPIARPRRAARS